MKPLRKLAALPLRPVVRVADMLADVSARVERTAERMADTLWRAAGRIERIANKIEGL